MRLLVTAWITLQFLLAAVSPSALHTPHRNEPGVCTDECYAVATCQEELGGRCDCPKYLRGPNCARNATPSHLDGFGQSWALEAKDPMPCLNDCNGLGTCRMGSCSCAKGRFGSDCSSSLGAGGRPELLAGRGYTPRAKRPRIYVYDIPHKYSSWHSPMRLDRGLPWVFWQRLLGSGALVGDGEEADWYYIPVKLRTTSDGYRLLEAITYIRENWPWYDRLHGSRHFVLHTGDTGRGEVTKQVRLATDNVTWLHHWGLTADYPYSGWKAAHRPGKDVVVPIYFGARQGSAYVPTSGLHPLAPRLPRTGTLLFAGRICGDHSKPDPSKPWPHCATKRSQGYSQGARQRVHFHHHNRTGYKIVTGLPHHTYMVDLLSYKWCLAPSGGGHGHRQVLVAAMGCLPLVVSDSVLQPFEPELDWGAFSLRVAQEAVPTLHEALEGVGEEGYQRRTDALRCATQHMLFSTMSGAFMREDGRWDAFEMVLEILRMQQTYPGLDPSQYAATDEQYRTFVNCGEADMATYGAKLRKAHAERYPDALTAHGGGAAITSWEQLSDPKGLDRVMQRAEEMEEQGGPEELPLCSMSNWDNKKLRCRSIAGEVTAAEAAAEAARGEAARAVGNSGLAHPPGGGACVRHWGKLEACPRLWQ